ncbi:MAG: hypothetical protein CBC28_00060, partial [Flavobacteriaceae bacterium TMED68]
SNIVLPYLDIHNLTLTDLILISNPNDCERIANIHIKKMPNFKLFPTYFSHIAILTFELMAGLFIINDFLPVFLIFLDIKVSNVVCFIQLFFIFEHINSSLSENNFFTTPSIPYRDSNFRFGLNWNLFN